VGIVVERVKELPIPMRRWNAKPEWVTQRRTSELPLHRLALITKLSDAFEKENLKEDIRVSAVTKTRERHASQRG